MEQTASRYSAIKHKISIALRKTSADIAPVVAVIAIAMSLGIACRYLLPESMESAGTFIYESAFSLSRLIMPLVTIIIAVHIAGRKVLCSSAIAGIIIYTGSHPLSPTGDVRGASGVFGAVIAGAGVGLITILIERVSAKISVNYIKATLLYAVTSLIGFIIAILLNTISVYLSTSLSVLLAGLSTYSKVLTVMLLGGLIGTDIGGPLYMSGYLFGSASIATAEPFYMACVFASGTVVTFTMIITAIMSKKDMPYSDRLYAGILVNPSLMGIPTGAVPFFVTKGLKATIPCFAGGVAASLLCYLLKVEAALPEGGLLSVAIMDHTTLFSYLVSVAFGTLISVFIFRIINTNNDDTESIPNTANRQIRKLQT